MTKLLVRLFIRTDKAESEARRSYGRLAGITGVTVNLLLFAVKLAAG
ncbi:MAG: cation-efflux pump, partial [Clostridiales bacterium]|nr:cation-efflux pump [Clostridiales bacterium]